MPSLRTLGLSAATTDNLQGFELLSNVEEVYLRSDNALRCWAWHLHRLPNLKMLRLYFPGPVGDVRLPRLPRLDSLAVQSEDWCLDENIAAIVSWDLPELRELTVSGSRRPRNDNSRYFTQVSQLRHLEELNLRDTSLTDKELMLLSGMPKLRAIFFLGTEITPAGIDSFKTANPQVTVNCPTP